MGPPHSKTVEGFEVTLGTNVIGSAHLANQLLSTILKSDDGRIVFLSSGMANVPTISLTEQYF